jgi:metal-responsive CopG/Arc/MetJ family transcriptional regulator
MPTKNARVNVVLEKPLYTAVSEFAKKQGVSKSMIVRDLIKEALELREDRALAEFAEMRETTIDATKALDHKEVWA